MYAEAQPHKTQRSQSCDAVLEQGEAQRAVEFSSTEAWARTRGWTW